MIDRRSGKIINISSIAAHLGRPITSAGYSASKAGVLGFTMSVARFVAPHGSRLPLSLNTLVSRVLSPRALPEYFSAML